MRIIKAAQSLRISQASLSSAHPHYLTMTVSNSIQEDSVGVLIAVMGATGSGKSTFINTLSGSDLAVGAGLKSCTSKVETSDTFELAGRLVTLVDTPGFDDTMVSDTDILKMIGIYLSATYQAGFKLSGVIYMHRISDFRMTGVSRRNFRMFRKLCGDDTLKNVTLVTNMWSQVTPERGAAREHQLRTDDIFFKPVLDEGARMVRHDGSRASAQAILLPIVSNYPMTLRIQREIVDERLDVTKTAAGIELDRELAELREQHKQQLAEIQREMQEALAANDLEAKKELEQVEADLRANISRIEGDRDRLSREFAAEKAKADARVQEVQEALRQEISLREQRQKELSTLNGDLQRMNTDFAREREQMQAQIREAGRRRRGGWFGGFVGGIVGTVFGGPLGGLALGSIGRAIDSAF